jgi:hypothetical protein
MVILLEIFVNHKINEIYINYQTTDKVSKKTVLK